MIIKELHWLPSICLFEFLKDYQVALFLFFNEVINYNFWSITLWCGELKWFGILAEWTIFVFHHLCDHKLIGMIAIGSLEFPAVIKLLVDVDCWPDSIIVIHWFICIMITLVQLLNWKHCGFLSTAHCLRSIVDLFWHQLAADRGWCFRGRGYLIKTVLDSSHSSLQQFLVRLEI